MKHCVHTVPRVCYFCVYTCGGDCWSEPCLGGGGYGLTTLDAYNALKIFVVFLLFFLFFCTFRFRFGSLILRRRVRTCVCFIVAVDVYINLDEQIEREYYNIAVTKALIQVESVQDKSCCWCCWHSSKYTPPPFFFSPLFCFRLIYLTDLSSLWATYCMAKVAHCVVARTHLWIRLGWCISVYIRP